MAGRTWGIGEPPPEAYSRTTNAERFRPLHRMVLHQVEQLQDRFVVERVEGYGIDAELEQTNLVRASIKLLPADSTAAPIVVAFTSFPSVVMRCGRWLVLVFPTCGCDACDETVEGEEQRLADVVEHVVLGRFRESIRIPWFGAAQQEWELGASTHGMAGGLRLTRSRARAMVNAADKNTVWSAWPQR